jgi:hypothetical protein
LRSRTVAPAPLRQPEPAVEPFRAPRLEPLRPGDVAVEYFGDAPVLARAGASGRVYTFSPAGRVRSVPAADASLLLRSALFRRHEQRDEPGAGAP